MLELRPNCECCDKELPPEATDAMICTFECTFCAACASDVLGGACPNCGGNFAPRPIRPAALLAKYRPPPGASSRPRDARRKPPDGVQPRKSPMIKRLAASAFVLAASAAPAFAHLDPAGHGSFLAGVSHPLFGLDHILAMVTVGLWAALLAQGKDRRALWLVPAAFVGAMCAGFAAALVDLPLPFVEPAVLASVVTIGLLAAVGLAVPTGFAMALVGFFAVFHGHAHGGEIGAAGAFSYGAGFALSTALLHAAGVTVGLGMGGIFGVGAGHAAARVAGGAAALAGVWLAVSG